MSKTVKPIPIPKPQQLTDAETLGQFIRARRTQSGMGIHDAAALCGVAVGTMTKIERARGDVRLSSMLTICKMLGITLSIEAREN